MSKRVIDVDALLEWVNKNTHEGEWCGANGWQADIVFLHELIEKINNLANTEPAPQESSTNHINNNNLHELDDKNVADIGVGESQESIFDADGWCWDIGKAYDSSNHKEYPYTSLLFNLKDCDEPVLGMLFKILDTDVDSLSMKFHSYDVSGEHTPINKDNFIAWRPLPKLPTGGNREN